MQLRRRNKTAESVDSHFASRLLPELFTGYEDGDQLTVLDLGPGNACTVDFLSRFRSKIFFADLLEHPCLRNPSEDNSTAAITDFIEQQLAIPDNTLVDICLLWDYPHYLDIPTLEALSSVLQPFFHKGTRAYGFGALHGNKPVDMNQYGIVDTTELLSRSIDIETKYLAHSQQCFGEHFLALRISRGTLLRGSRLELLFETH